MKYPAVAYWKQYFLSLTKVPLPNLPIYGSVKIVVIEKAEKIPGRLVTKRVTPPKAAACIVYDMTYTHLIDQDYSNSSSSCYHKALELASPMEFSGRYHAFHPRLCKKTGRFVKLTFEAK